MKRLGKILLVIIAGVLLVLGGLLGYARYEVGKRIDAETAVAVAALKAHHEQFLLDERAVAALPLFARRTGTKDAGPFLNPRLDWQGGGARLAKWRASLPKDTPSLAIKREVREAISKDWLAADPAITDGLDFGWMDELAGFDFWDVEQNSPLTGASGMEFYAGPGAPFVDMTTWAKLRLLKAMRDGDVLAASAQVRELSRLVLSTETLLGAMVAVALLGVEDRAREHLAKAGSAPDGWKTVDEPTRLLVKRVLWAAPAYVDLVTPDEYAQAFAKLTVGRCVALNEAGQMALALRPYAGRPHKAGYERVTAQLGAATECRLVNLRRGWGEADPPVYAEGGLCSQMGNGEDCAALEAVSWVPGVNGLVGDILLSVASPGRFKQYEERSGAK